MTHSVQTSPLSLPTIALINCSDSIVEVLSSGNFGNRIFIRFNNSVDLLNSWESQTLNIAAIISYTEVIAPNGVSSLEALIKKKNIQIHFLLVTI